MSIDTLGPARVTAVVATTAHRDAHVCVARLNGCFTAHVVAPPACASPQDRSRHRAPPSAATCQFEWALRRASAQGCKSALHRHTWTADRDDLGIESSGRQTITLFSSSNVPWAFFFLVLLSADRRPCSALVSPSRQDASALGSFISNDIQQMDSVSPICNSLVSEMF